MFLPDSYCRSSSIRAVSSPVGGRVSRCGALAHRDSTVGQGDDRLMYSPSSYGMAPNDRVEREASKAGKANGAARDE